jgi:hypothetical protein
MSQPNPYDPPPPSAYPPSGYGPASPNQTPMILAVGSLVTGVLSLISCVPLCGCILMPMPLIALVLGGVTLSQKPDQNAKIMAIIGIALAGLTIAAWIVMMVLNIVMGMSNPRFPQTDEFEGF